MARKKNILLFKFLEMNLAKKKRLVFQDIALLIRQKVFANRWQSSVFEKELPVHSCFQEEIMYKRQFEERLPALRAFSRLASGDSLLYRSSFGKKFELFQLIFLAKSPIFFVPFLSWRKVVFVIVLESFYLL